MAHTPQEIFKVIVLHNRILMEEDVDQLLKETPDPEAVVQKMIMAEMISEQKAEKVLALYRHNLEKVGLTPVGAGNGGGGGGGEAAVTTGRAVQHVDASPRNEGRGGGGGDRPAMGAMPGPKGVPSAGNAIVHWLLRAAREAKASDLHIKSNAKPMLRIAGSLREIDMPPLTADGVEEALRSMLSPEDEAKFLRNEDVDFGYDGGQGLGRFRVSVVRHFRGMDGVFRVIPDKLPDFEALKLPPQVKRFTQYRQGLVLVTGPKGSGKTTTLAALVDLINSYRPEHVITIEDPIEFVHTCKRGHVTQREVGAHTRSFATALRAALREAPDVIMVGELRDLETTRLALSAAEQGQLVIATLPTADVPRTIGRVLDVFPAEEQEAVRAKLAESLRGIISQQLVPGADGNTMHLAYEVLFNIPAAANLIRENKAFQLKGVMQTHKKQGMCIMDEVLVQLVREGKIDKREAVARADQAALVEREASHGGTGAGHGAAVQQHQQAPPPAAARPAVQPPAGHVAHEAISSYGSFGTQGK